jgi:hypothetical protein
LNTFRWVVVVGRWDEDVLGRWSKSVDILELFRCAEDAQSWLVLMRQISYLLLKSVADDLE